MLSPEQIAGLIAAVSFAAGLNVYATVATLGLLSRANVVELPPALHLVHSWPVIGIAIAMFVIEFFADKIPGFDLVWNALHTFIRVPVAALLAYGASQRLSPEAQVIAAVVGGAIALAAHGGKTAARAAVTPSPEPFSNIALSTGEDVGAIGLTWFATVHPMVAALIVLVLLTLTGLMVRFIWRAMRRLFRGAERQMEGFDADTPT
ncbi:MAG: DUF4126 domain-containing protein [Terriglobales bacterium]